MYGIEYLINNLLEMFKCHVFHLLPTGIRKVLFSPVSVCFFFFYKVCLRDNSKNPYPISIKFSHNLLGVQSSDAIENGHPTATTFGRRPQSAVLKSS